jgi:GNAT superfamily N-acetyltransferase
MGKYKATRFGTLLQEPGYFRKAVESIEYVNERTHQAPRTPGFTEIKIQWSQSSAVNFHPEKYPPQPTLVYRDETGNIRGFMIYFPTDSPAYEHGERDHAGDFHILVEKSHRRRGIGGTLLKEAVKRYSINFDQQEYTRSGAALVNAFVERNSHEEEQQGYGCSTQEKMNKREEQETE